MQTLIVAVLSLLILPDLAWAGPMKDFWVNGEGAPMLKLLYLAVGLVVIKAICNAIGAGTAAKFFDITGKLVAVSIFIKILNDVLRDIGLGIW